MFGPLNRREDGTVVFASPVGDGHVPMIALSDLGYFARYSFDHREEVSGKDLEIVSEVVGWDHLVETFTRVTGQKAVYKRQTVDEWMNNFTNIDRPLAIQGVEGGTTWRQNFSYVISMKNPIRTSLSDRCFFLRHRSFWRQWRDDVITRDVEWNRRINPHGQSLESWMRTTNYVGRIDPSFLKNFSESRRTGINWDVVKAL